MSKSKQTEVTQTETAPVTNTFDPTSFGSMDQLIQTHGNVSKVIRYLAGQGLTRSQIAKVTGKVYQHVRNVLITPVKTAR